MSEPKCKAQDPANCRYHKTGFYVEFGDMRVNTVDENSGLTQCELKALRRSLFMRDLPGNSEVEVIGRVRAAHNQIRDLSSRRLITVEKKEIAQVNKASRLAEIELDKSRANIDFLYPRNSVRLLVTEVFADPHKLLDDLTRQSSLDLFVIGRDNFNSILLDYTEDCIGYSFKTKGSPSTVKPMDIIDILLGPWRETF